MQSYGGHLTAARWKYGVWTHWRCGGIRLPFGCAASISDCIMEASWYATTPHVC
jgi:hypothetical protein